jgi:hypothetical protein
MNHPAENDLALLAGGDAAWVRRFLMQRHVGACEDCRKKVADYRDLREAVADFELPEMNWNALAVEMRANIAVGLEAGACVGGAREPLHWNPRFAVAFACLLVLMGSNFFLRMHRTPVVEAAGPVAQSTTSGIELRKGSHRLIFPNHEGSRADQTVSAQGEIRSRYVDGETGSVTITNVYLEQ